MATDIQTDLPILHGTPKQIAYAERVRVRTLQQLDGIAPAEAVRQFIGACDDALFLKTGEMVFVEAIADDGTLTFGRDPLPDIEGPEDVSQAGVMALVAKMRDWLAAETSAAAVLDRMVGGLTNGLWTKAAFQAAINAL